MSLYPDNTPILVYQQHNYCQWYAIEIVTLNEMLRQRGLVGRILARMTFEEQARM